MQPINVILSVNSFWAQSIIRMHYWEKFGFFGGHVFLDFINTYDDLGKHVTKMRCPIGSQC